MSLFKKNKRNDNLRNNILKQHISSVMTDDERAELWNLPKGCRMRENAKILSPENFICGEYVWIGEGAILGARAVAMKSLDAWTIYVGNPAKPVKSREIPS